MRGRGHELIIAVVWWMGLQATGEELVLALARIHRGWAVLKAYECNKMVGGATLGNGTTTTVHVVVVVGISVLKFTS